LQGRNPMLVNPIVMLLGEMPCSGGAQEVPAAYSGPELRPLRPSSRRTRPTGESTNPHGRPPVRSLRGRWLFESTGCDPSGTLLSSGGSSKEPCYFLVRSMNPQLRRVLLAENPWLRGVALQEWTRHFLPASYIPRRLQLFADHRVVLVVGPRQAGKSTLIWKTLLEAAEPVLYLNCEEPSIREWLSSPAAFLADLAEVGQVHGLFFEEVQ